MIIDRQVAVTKVEGLLGGAFPQNEIYEWALFIAVSPEYEAVVKTDPLLEHLIQFLLEINNQRPRPLPLPQILDYYRSCLKGEQSFDPAHVQQIIQGAVFPRETESAMAAEQEDGKGGKKEKQNRRYGERFNYTARVYIKIFGFCSLAIHLFSILKPDFLMHGVAAAPTRLDVLANSWPHILYAAVVLFPKRFLVRGVWYFVTFAILTWGMLYYWYISTAMVMKLSLNFIFVLVILPFSAIPATLALVLFFFYRAEEIHKR